MKYIENSIKNYLLSKEPDYALMINGEWGSGKSFYFDNYVINTYEESHNFIFTSAYGIDTSNQLVNQIAIQKNPILKKINSSKPLRIGANLASNLFKAVAPMLKIGSNITDDENVLVSGNVGKTNIDISDFWSFNQNDVIVIDDIERSKIPIDELFGFISTNFLNSKACKIILICSEKELIKKFQLEDGKENQYLSSKEKVVRHSIKFEWSPETIVPLVVYDIISDKDLGEFLINDTKEFLIESLNIIKGRNLRKLKFFLQNVEYLNSILGFPRLKSCYKSLFQFLFLVSLEQIEGRLANDESFAKSTINEYFKNDFKNDKIPNYSSLFKLYEEEVFRTEQIYNLAKSGYVDFKKISEDIERYSNIDNPLNDWKSVIRQIKRFELLTQAEFTQAYSSAKEYLKSEKYDVYEICSLSRIFCDLLEHEIILDFSGYNEIEQYFLPKFEKAIGRSNYKTEEHPDDQHSSYMARTPKLKTRLLAVHQEMINKQDFDELNMYLQKQKEESTKLNAEIIERILRNNDDSLVKMISDLYLNQFKFSVNFIETMKFLENQIDDKRLTDISPALETISNHLNKSNLNSKGNIAFFHIREFNQALNRLKNKKPVSNNAFGEGTERQNIKDNPSNGWKSVIQQIQRFELLTQSEFTQAYSSVKEYLKNEKYDIYEICLLSHIFCALLEHEIILDFSGYNEVEQYFLPKFEKAIGRSNYKTEEHPDDQPSFYMAKTPKLKTRLLAVHQEMINKQDFDELNMYLQKQKEESTKLNAEIIERILRNNDDSLVKMISDLYLNQFKFSVNFIETMKLLENQIDDKRLADISPALETISNHLNKSNLNSKGNIVLFHINKYNELLNRLKDKKPLGSNA